VIWSSPAPTNPNENLGSLPSSPWKSCVRLLCSSFHLGIQSLFSGVHHHLDYLDTYQSLYDYNRYNINTYIRVLKEIDHILLYILIGFIYVLG
jgi:hypothetical protein